MADINNSLGQIGITPPLQDLQSVLDEGNSALDQSITLGSIFTDFYVELSVEAIIHGSPTEGGFGQFSVLSNGTISSVLNLDNGFSKEAGFGIDTSPYLYFFDNEINTSTGIHFDNLLINENPKFQVPALQTDEYTLPISVNGNFADINGDITLSMSAAAAGSTNQVQYNVGGLLAASNQFVWEPSFNRLNVGNATSSSNGIIVVGGSGTGIGTISGGGGALNVVGGDLTLESNPTHYMAFKTNTIERLRITNSGEWTLAGVSGTSGQSIVSNGVGVVPTWQSVQLLSQKNQPNGYVGLDGSSKINASFLPAIAITEVYTVASQVAQLALIADEGDVAIRTDLSKSYIHNGGISGTMADWSELLSPTDGVQSVLGTTNRITSSGGINPTIDISSSYIGQTSITTLGTITTGTWQGSSISDTYISSAATWNAKQNALSGTGLVKSTAGTISYITDNSTNWDIAYTNRITSLTTTGSSGASTLISNTLNIPNYTAAGLGAVPTTRLLNINGNSYDLSANREWRTALADTGALTYAGISVASGTQVNIGAVTGYIVNNETNPALPSYIFINYAGEAGKTVTTLGSGIVTYVLLNSSGTIVFQNTFPTSAQRKTHIYLSKIAHPGGTITTAGNEVDFITSPQSQFRDFFQTINYVNQGVTTAPVAASLTFSSTTGTITGDGINFVADNTNPNTLTIAPQSPVSFLPRTQTGAGGLATTTVAVASYDVAGTVTTIPGGGNISTLRYVFLVPGLGFVVQYGQTTYTNLVNAVAAVGKESFTIYPSLVRNAILVGVIAARKGATNLADTNDAQFFKADIFGQIIGASAGVSVGTMQTAYNNSLVPQVTVTDALGAMTWRNGRALNSSTISEWQNIAGTTVAQMTGNGDFTANSFIKTGGTATQLLLANGTTTPVTDFAKVIAKQVEVGSTSTGTTAEVIIGAYQITAGEFAAGNRLESYFEFTKVGVAGATTLRIRVNTSNSLSGATQVGMFSPTSAQIAGGLIRTLNFRVGDILEFYPPTQAAAQDSTPSALPRATMSLSPASTFWVLFTAQLASAADSIAVAGGTIIKY